ncbi:hypothetical protein FY134_27160 (plasmid) [Agrobacterium fabrum]|uniref:hypothetical protein n=1 Tax=Agrobacterium fabrum TaxID=1176649 RepID=UPI0021CF58AD|nr:hypothetical protein [Agrobacterium fabrum]MDH6298730.1 hypothetical protein [Agrobacterium fabrum]UXT61380.1 hypothetical protein FY134_27160 [Agrobacterium fabrum]
MISFDRRNDRLLYAAVHADLKLHMTAFRYLMALTFVFALLLRFVLPLDKAMEAGMAMTTTVDSKSKTLLLSLLMFSAVFGIIREPKTRRMARITANFVAGTIISSALVLGAAFGLGTGEAFFLSIGGAASSSWQEILVLFSDTVSTALVVIAAVPIVLMIGNFPIAYYGEET